MLAFGLTTITNAYTVDTVPGPVFSIARTTANSADVGDLTSATLNGTQFEAPYSYESRYSHYESGLSSSTVVTAATDPNGNWILIACDDASGYGVIQYYFARKGYNNIYMATYSAGPGSPSPGEMRFIMYTNPSVLYQIPANFEQQREQWGDRKPRTSSGSPTETPAASTTASTARSHSQTMGIPEAVLASS